MLVMTSAEANPTAIRKLLSGLDVDVEQTEEGVSVKVEGSLKKRYGVLKLLERLKFTQTFPEPRRSLCASRS